MRRHPLHRRVPARRLWRTRTPPPLRSRLHVWGKAALGRLASVDFKRATAFLFAVAVLVYAYREIARTVLIIDPFTVPKRYSDAGLTSEVFANRVGDKLRQIEAAAQTSVQRDTLASIREEASMPAIEIPGTKVGSKTVVELARSLFGIYPKRVSGDIVFPVNGAEKGGPSADLPTVTVYVSQGRNRGPGRKVSVAGDDLDLVVEKTAEAALEQVNPYIFAIDAEARHDYGEANEALQSIVDSSSARPADKADALTQLGNILADEGSADQAVAKYRQAIDQDPKSPYAFHNLGLTLTLRGKYQEALPYLRKAIEIDPKIPYQYLDLGNALLGMQENAQASAVYRKGIAVDPKYAYLREALADTLASQKKYAEAIAEYQSAIRLDPRDANAYVGWGNALLAQGLYAPAIAKAAKATEADPANKYAYCVWGNALRSLKQYDLAVAKFQKALQIDPKYADALAGRGEALDAQGKYDQAIADFRQAIEIDPATEEAYVGWGDLLRRQGKSEDAVARYRRAAELDRDDPEAYAGWASALNQEGKAQEAAAIAKKAASLSPFR